MRLCFICIGFLFFSCSLKSPKKIECTLIEFPTSLGSCGIFSYCEGMKFQKIGSKTLFVGLINCPEMKGKDFFKKGVKYKIIVSYEKIDKVCDITRNYYKDQNLTTYLVDDIYIK